MPKIYVLFVFSIIIATSCATSTARFTALLPADKTLDDHIRRIVTVDRSAPSSKTANVIEGVFTGENIRQDRNGRLAALDGLAQAFEEHKYFDVVHSGIVLNGSKTGGLMVKPLSWREVTQIAEEYDADAVLVMESYDSDTHDGVYDVVGLVSGRWDANGQLIYNSNVRIGWRLYDVMKKDVVDEVQSFDNLGFQNYGAYGSYGPVFEGEQVLDVSYQAGVNYAGRIIPLPVDFVRKYYVRAHQITKDLKVAENLIKIGEWNQAIAIWESEYDFTTKDRTKRRLAYNLAVGYEQKGDFQKALDYAIESASLGCKSAIDLVQILRLRIKDNEKLKIQMKRS